MIWIQTDKPRNIYKISPSKYNKILHNEITEMYKIDKKDTVNKINKDTARFANKLNIKDKRGKLNEKKNAYIFFKDHKRNFDNHKQARLINPTKTELGLVAKNVI